MLSDGHNMGVYIELIQTQMSPIFTQLLPENATQLIAAAGHGENFPLVYQ